MYVPKKWILSRENEPIHTAQMIMRKSYAFRYMSEQKDQFTIKEYKYV